MTKKLTHRLVLDVTFSKAVNEREAYDFVRPGLDLQGVNQRSRKFFILPIPTIIKITVKRWSKVLPHVLKGETK